MFKSPQTLTMCLNMSYAFVGISCSIFFFQGNYACFFFFFGFPDKMNEGSWQGMYGIAL